MVISESGSRQTDIALTLEVPVKGKGAVDAEAAHRFKADAVDEAEFLAARHQHCRQPRLVQALLDPLDCYQGEKRLLHGSGGREAKPALRDGERLQEHIICADWLLLIQQYRFPGFFRPGMMPVTGIY